MLTRNRFAPGWKATGARLAALIVLQGICPGPARAQETAKPPSSEEFAKQEKIYRSQGKDVPGGYVTSRSLASYYELLPSGFRAALGRLGPKDRWLDIGAGSGKAILDYYAPEYDSAQAGKRAQSRGKAQAVAISIEDRRSDLWRQRAESLGEDRIRYLFGKRLREYPDEELGKFQIITDVYGGFSYTEQLSRFVEKVLGALEVKGSFYTMVQSVHLQNGKEDPKTWWLTELADARGRNVTVCAWLKNVRCAKTTCESKSTWDTPTELIHVRKVCNDVRVPPLNQTYYEAGNPPGRRFQLAP